MLKVIGLSIVVTGVIDFIWLAFIANKLYGAALGPWLRLSADGRLEPVIWAALLVYLCIPLGIVAFVLPRAGADATFLQVFAWGALYGAAVYGTYDMTNYSLMKDWPLHISLIDWVWGMVLCGSASAITHSLTSSAQ